MPTAGLDFGTAVDPIAHIIRLALTPVFLLLSIANLLNVFSARLALVGDRAEQATKALETADTDDAPELRRQLRQLYRRSLALDAAVILASVAKAGVCIAVLLLFVGALGDEAVALVLLVAFGGAVVCALGAILAYAAEMLMAGTGVRAELAHGERRHVMNFLRRSHTGT
ncbi:MAG TPA: DUF2721 domain-containing protein [Stellaceae bacterium]|jgi:hypothetical protein|nr:DUF2721 domain-containing protein [Stellaceae bacterium]